MLQSEGGEGGGGSKTRGGGRLSFVYSRDTSAGQLKMIIDFHVPGFQDSRIGRHGKGLGGDAAI